MVLEKFNKNKIVIITGAGSGIGRATALLFAKKTDKKIIVVDVNNSEGKETVKGIKNIGKDAEFFNLDLRARNDIRDMMERLQADLADIDVLINNAGIGHTGSVTTTDEKDWDDVINVNLTSIFLLSKFVIPFMIKNKGGSIVNVSSISGLLGWPDSAAYCTTKGGIINLTREMAVDYAKYNIRVNCVCPGTTNTAMLGRLLSKASESEINEIKRMHPLNRFADPVEIANAIYFLASEDASFINGAILPVDGGFTAK